MYKTITSLDGTSQLVEITAEEESVIAAQQTAIPAVVDGAIFSSIIDRYTVSNGVVRKKTVAELSISDMLIAAVTAISSNSAFPEETRLDIESNMTLFRRKSSLCRSEKAVTDLKFVPMITDAVIDELFRLSSE